MNDPTYPPGEFKAVDPWAHRSAGMACETCMWFVIKETETRHVIKSTKSLGRCRKHAPTMNGYPAVYTHDWCGDHKLDENKIEPLDPEKQAIMAHVAEKYPERVVDHVTPGPPVERNVPEKVMPYGGPPPYPSGDTGHPPPADIPSTSKAGDTPTAHQL